MVGLFLGVALVLSCGDGGPPTPTTRPFPEIPSTPPIQHFFLPTPVLMNLDTGKNHITWTWSASGERSDVWRSLDAAFTDTDEDIFRVRNTFSAAVYRWEGLAPGTTAYLRVRSVSRTSRTSAWSRTVKGVTDDE